MVITSSKDKNIAEETKKDNTASTTVGETPASSEAATVGKGQTILRGQASQAVRVIASFLEPKKSGAPEKNALLKEDSASYKAVSSEQHSLFYPKLKDKIAKITSRLLLAVAYGMESVDANTPIKKSDAGDLFKHNLYAKELLEKCPEYLLERGDVTDWAGRTFKNITAFEYAVWAKDFKMIEMMLGCIPKTSEGDEIRKELLRQYEQITSTRGDGGGLTYTHTYLRPNVDEKGVPIKDTAGNWDCEKVTVERWENHFDLTPLTETYEDYARNLNARTWPEREACLTKGVGTLQHLLPVHILQRYCDPKTPFFPLPSFNGEFKRSTDFYNHGTGVASSLFGSWPSSDFAVVRGDASDCCLARPRCISDLVRRETDAIAVRRLDEVGSNEIKNIIQQLSQQRHEPGSIESHKKFEV